MSKKVEKQEATRPLTDIEKFIENTTGLGGSEAVLAVSEINKDARRRVLEGKLEKTKVALERAKAEKPLELEYFCAGTADMLTGELPAKDAVNVDELIVEMAMYAKHAGFGVVGSKSISIKAGFVAFVMLHESLGKYFSIDLDTALVPEPNQFKVIHVRGSR